jgi:hypothetical protein
MKQNLSIPQAQFYRIAIFKNWYAFLAKKMHSDSYRRGCVCVSSNMCHLWSCWVNISEIWYLVLQKELLGKFRFDLHWANLTSTLHDLKLNFVDFLKRDYCKFMYVCDKFCIQWLQPCIGVLERIINTINTIQKLVHDIKYRSH